MSKKPKPNRLFAVPQHRDKVHEAHAEYNPLNHTLSSIGNKLTIKEKKAINELIEGLKKLYGNNLRRVILYGSKARGDSKMSSDIDIMVVLKKYESWSNEFDKVSALVYLIEEK